MTQQSETHKSVQSIAERTFGSVQPRGMPEDFDELRRIFEEGTALDAAKEASSGGADSNHVGGTL